MDMTCCGNTPYIRNFVANPCPTADENENSGEPGNTPGGGTNCGVAGLPRW
jgi:hypothetical protein